MTYFYYKTKTWFPNTETNQLNEEQINALKRFVEKKNWRITQLANGYYQTEFLTSENTWKDITRRETLDGAEAAIDSSIDHYKKKLQFVDGPIVVKTFK